VTERIRLLACKDCRVIEELPFFEGDPEDDVFLEHALLPHRFPNGEPHIGRLFDIEERYWRNPTTQQEVVKRIHDATSTGLDTEFYATKNTFAEDALKCYDLHNRPKEGCIDYRDSRKRLGNPTKRGWQTGPKVYLCDFCPVKSGYVDVEIRHKKGLYR
jgi:hypothetical protein